jgi:hypothetical protein
MESKNQNHSGNIVYLRYFITNKRTLLVLFMLLLIILMMLTLLSGVVENDGFNK